MSEPQDESDATMAMPIGVVVGQRFAKRYEIEKLLGRGGMGAVYRARDREVDELIALKLLDGTHASAEAVERFRREVRLARRVTHRNTARTYDLGEWRSDSGSAGAGRVWRYLTMEYVEGPSLRELSRKGTRRLPPAQVIDIAHQLAQGLAAAHQAGVVHRDLKPANVLVEPSGRVVITDFGIARGTAAGDATLHTGGLLGTPAYMAPEQIAGESVDARADLYALGLIIFELLTGKLPFTGDTAMAIALARLSQPLPRLADEPAIPAALAPVLERLLAREVEQRFPSAEPLVDELAELRRNPSLAELEGDSSGPATATSSPRASGPATTKTPTPSAGTTTATPVRRGRKLAVLPFRYRGPEGERHVAEALSDELIDLLSTMKGLQVSASGATARFASEGDRDPRSIGAQLQVDAIVDGTVQLSGTRLRVAARLLDVENGFQLWAERYEGSLEDVFELQDKMGKRIAEALRLELEHLAHRGDASAEAIDLYLRARAQARLWEFGGEQGAAALFERCLALAPSLQPAISGLAIAAVRGWFSPRDEGRDWAALASVAVERARIEAPDLAETHLAIGMLSVHRGDYAEAARALAQAIRIAPTYAAAHDYLGRLQLEAGQPELGMRHLELAIALDPELGWSLPAIARYHALRGDRAEHDAIMQRYFQLVGRDDEMSAVAQQIRVASWFGDLDEVRRQFAKLPASAPDTAMIRTYVDILTSDGLDGQRAALMLDQVAGSIPNPRFASMILQISAEALASRGLEDVAMHSLERAAASVLVDHDWLERCPLLTPLRRRPEYVEVRDKVLTRARAIWGI